MIGADGRSLVIANLPGGLTVVITILHKGQSTEIESVKRIENDSRGLESSSQYFSQDGPGLVSLERSENA